MINMDAVKNFSIDKSNWIKVKFGDVVFEPKESVKDPAAAGIEHVVGLEHIDSGDIHLRRSASIEESTTFTKKFTKGDVLFGRRRAYLKKAALASFDGICSGDITVMRAKDELLPELLPFIVNNDKFFDYAITHSAGGLSPRVKYKDLANYKFLIPDESAQYDLVKLLYALDSCIEYNLNLKKKLELFRITYSESVLENIKNDFPNKAIKLKEILCEARLGGNYSNDKEEKGLPLIKMGNLGRGKINLKKLEYIPDSIEFDQNDLLNDGDLLFNTRNTLELVGKVSIWSNELPQALYNSNILRLTFDSNYVFSNKYMNLVFNSRKGIAQLRSFAVGTTSVAAIYQPEILRFKVPVIPIKNQVELVKTIEIIDECIGRHSRKIFHFKKMIISLVDKVF